MKKINTGKIALLLIISNFLVKIFGLLRETLLASIYGTSIYTDAYVIANNIPTVLFSAIGVSISTTYIPMYSKITSEQGEKRANSFTLHLIVTILCICIIMCLLGEFFTKEVVLIFAKGFKNETLTVTISFVKILLPSIFALAIMNVLGGFLQCHHNFGPIAFVPVIGNISIITCLIISKYTQNIYFFVYGTLLGLFAQALFYIPFVLKNGLFIGDVAISRSDNYVSELLLLVVPVFCAEAVNELNTIIDRTIVSGFETGSVSALNYAYKVINLIMGVVIVSLVTVIYPELAKLYNKGKEYGETAERYIVLILTVIFPITFLTFIFSRDIVSVLFQYGNFNENSAKMTTKALSYYSIGLLGLGIREILVKIFLSRQDTKTPMFNGIICTGVNICLSMLLSINLGANGVALATSISIMISSINLFWLCNKHRIIDIKRIKRSILVVLFTTMIFDLNVYLGIYIIRKHISFSFEYILACFMWIIFCGLIYIKLQMYLKNEGIIYFLKRKNNEK